MMKERSLCRPPHLLMMLLCATTMLLTAAKRAQNSQSAASLAAQVEDREDAEQDEPESVFEKTVNVKDEKVGCYCKQVVSMSECVDNKHPKDASKVTGPRFFHPNMKDSGEGHLCCKADWTSLFTFHGWSYKRYDDIMLCEREVREVPEDACCWLRDGHGSIGLKVRQASSAVQVSHRIKGYGWDLDFRKSAPTFSLEDIVEGHDHNGETVDIEDVRSFVQMNLDSGRFEQKLECGGSWGSFSDLFAASTGGSACRLRTAQTEECCCHQSSLVEAVRCLPAAGAAMGEDAKPKIVDGSYSESTLHGKRKGTIEGTMRTPTPALEAALVGILRDVVDPEMQNDETTSVNESALKWTWAASGQWVKQCVKHKSVPWVKTVRKSKRVKNGKRCMKMGRGPMRCTQKWKTKTWVEYHQQFKTECISYKFSRRCPPGTGRFVKQIDQGQYFQEPSVASDENLALKDLGSLMFECPDEFRSGTGGTAKYSAKCRCGGKGSMYSADPEDADDDDV